MIGQASQAAPIIILKRLRQWLEEWFHWEAKPPAPHAAAACDELRSEHQQKIDGFNRALAAAAAMRTLLEHQINQLRARQATLEGELRKTLQTGDEKHGAALAFDLQTGATELQQLEQRLEEASRHSSELEALREEAIRMAQRELDQAAQLSQTAALSSLHRPPGPKASE